MKKSIVCFFALILTFCCIFVPAGETRFASAVEEDVSVTLKLSARSAFLMDYDTDIVIYEKNANERLPVASMTKLALLWVVFDYLNKGIIKENDYVLVSENAAAVGGSSAFLDSGSSYKLSELVKSVIVASANDSSVALAEKVCGSEELFVSKMNQKVMSLGLQNTNFVNCTGLPADDHYSSAYDMAQIYKQVCDNKLYKKYAKIWMDDFVHPSGRKTGLVNTNRLVKTFDGIEGGKTGYTDAAKFCLTTSAKRGNSRFVAVVIGVSDSKTRFAEARKLLNFGFANFEHKVVTNAEVPVTIHKFKAAKKPVQIYPEKTIVKLMSKTEDEQFSTDYQINELKAPIKKGDVVGKMFVFDKNNMVVDEIRLIVKTDVAQLGVKESLKKLIKSW